MRQPQPPIRQYAAVAIAMLALLVRVLVPVGFMVGTPSHGATGTISIVLCTAQGQINALMNADGQIVEADPSAPDKDKDHKSTSGDCAFASGNHASLATPFAAASEPIAPYYSVPVPARLHDLVPGRGLAAPPPPATASPFLI
jgi:hypothetical protein